MAEAVHRIQACQTLIVPLEQKYQQKETPLSEASLVGSSISQGIFHHKCPPTEPNLKSAKGNSKIV
jgi:hypothetical protein